jgi:GNAT superfamily N-acetyltransferase
VSLDGEIGRTRRNGQAVHEVLKSVRPREEEDTPLTARAIMRPATSQDGIVDLPPGKIAAIATYLEMRRLPGGTALRDTEESGGTFESMAGNLARYRALYKTVGEPWLWFSRARLSDAALARIIDDPLVEPLAFHRHGADLGIAELDFRRPGQCELSFLGLVPDAIGRGYGQVLIAEAIRRAFMRRIERLWLHTCTLDHPAALGFYIAAGFQPFRRAVEVAEDPRLTGELPRQAAAHLPII